MKPAPEKFRETTGVLATTKDMGNNGCFKVPHPKIDGYYFSCLSSSGNGWEHVSVVIASNRRKVERCPTWEEMCFIKELFWEDTEPVVQIHPPKAHHVNNHAYCLHMWRSTDKEMPLPSPYMVGMPGVSPKLAEKIVSELKSTQ